MTMFLYLIALLTQIGDPVDRAFQAYEVKHREPLSFEAVYRASNFASEPLEVRVQADGRRRLHLAIPADKTGYEFVVGPDLVREIAHEDELYRDYRYEGGVIFPGRPLTSKLDLFPSWLYGKDRKAFAQVPWAVTATKNVDGKQVTTMTGHAVGPHGEKVDAEIAIDQDGTVHAYQVFVDSPMEKYKIRWDLVSYSPTASFAPDTFALEIPRGFTPSTAELVAPRIQVGLEFPLEGWAGATPLAEKVSKAGALVAFVDAEAPSEAARRSLKTLGGEMAVVTIGIGADGDYHDPDGKLLDQIDPPAYPFFVLVGADGKVKKLWMGFDAAKAGRFEDEVRQATRD